MAERLVLLVDDHADSLDLYAEYLRFHGYAVAVACNGHEAISVARAKGPSVVFLDIEMPVMGGIDVLRILRADPRFGRTFIVALTAHALEPQRAEALRAGFDEFLAKPCLPDALMATLERLLKTERPE
jgi:CheY-like chemotaxis protein